MIFLVAGHDEKGLLVKGLVMGAQSIAVVMLLNIYYFLGAGYNLDGHVIVSAFFQHHQTSIFFL